MPHLEFRIRYLSYYKQCILSFSVPWHSYFLFVPFPTHPQICLYGKPTSTEEYCFRAQIANFVQYRALFEAHGSAMWTKCTGVLLWKIQNPWPGLRGQLYDFFLGQTGGLYGSKVDDAILWHCVFFSPREESHCPPTQVFSYDHPRLSDCVTGCAHAAAYTAQPVDIGC